MHPLIVSLKTLRLRLGLTQVHLSELSGIKQPHIARIENGEPCTMKTYDRLLMALRAAERERATALQAVSQEMPHGDR